MFSFTNSSVFIALRDRIFLHCSKSLTSPNVFASRRHEIKIMSVTSNRFFSVLSTDTLNVLSCMRGGSVYPLRLTSDSDSDSETDSDVGPNRALSESHRCTAIQRLITVLSLIFVSACHSTGLMERISALIALQNERKKIVINQNYIFLICKVHFKKINYVVLSRNPVGIGPTVSKRTLYVLVFYNVYSIL